MAVVLALVSAAAYGVSDFLGGIFSKRASAWQVATVGQFSSGVCALALVPLLGGDPTGHDWLWGAISGLGSGSGAAFLYRGLSSGRMAVVAPVSAIGSALVPVGVGLLTGDRPAALAWVGIACAFPAIYLISKVTDSGDGPKAGGLLDGVLAGLGFGALFASLGQVDGDAGIAPLALSQAVAFLTVIAIATILRKPWLPRGRAALYPLCMGPLGAAATGSFLYATHEGLLAIVSVIAALYPALTVLLAAVLLHEHIHRAQAYGLALAAVAVSLVAAG